MDREFLIRVSYVEIYNEIVRDLLHPACKKVEVRESNERVRSHLAVVLVEVVLMLGPAGRVHGVQRRNYYKCGSCAGVLATRRTCAISWIDRYEQAIKVCVCVLLVVVGDPRPPLKKVLS